MCIFRFSKKHHLVCFLSLLNYGDIGSVLINHLHIVIPLSYPCYYTNLCPRKPQKPVHTHTHTHTHSVVLHICWNTAVEICYTPGGRRHQFYVFMCVYLCECVCVFPVFCSTPIINLRAELPLTRVSEKERDRTSVGGSVFSSLLQMDHIPQTHTHTILWKNAQANRPLFIVSFLAQRVVFLSLSFPPDFFSFICSFHRCEMLDSAR